MIRIIAAAEPQRAPAAGADHARGWPARTVDHAVGGVFGPAGMPKEIVERGEVWRRVVAEVGIKPE